MAELSNKTNISLKTLPMTRESSVAAPMPLWLSLQEHTQINCSKLTSVNMTQNGWNKNGQKQPKNSSREMSKRLKPHQASRISIFRLISLSLS
jgi:hypothetical protein